MLEHWLSTKRLPYSLLTADGVVSETEQAVFSGAVCIDIPTEAAETLRGGNQAKLTNIAFENVVMSDCGTW